jgi:NAD(P)-dependent dehydrogenase (short-subunit alcohol dehydrogenase family)
MTRFQNKTAIVTGAAGGIGVAIARRLAQEGANLVLADIDDAHVKSTAESFAGDGLPRALGVRCDVGRLADVEACVALTMQTFGHLDVVINNAGRMTFKALDEWTEDDWLQVLKVDLLGAAFFTREALRSMNNGGAIVNIASIHAVRTSPLAAPYAAAKAALLSLTRSTAIEGKARFIRCNAILPGAIDTPMLWKNPNIQSGAEKIEKSDIGAPADIAAAAAFLASEDARFITGAALAVDGGRLAAL